MARTNDMWETVKGGPNGIYIQTIDPDGYDILINGLSRYLNFNAVVGSAGYGFRDNSGQMEVKDSGGSWGPIATGGSIGTVVDEEQVAGSGTSWTLAQTPLGSIHLFANGQRITIAAGDYTIVGKNITTAQSWQIGTLFADYRY